MPGAVSPQLVDMDAALAHYSIELNPGEWKAIDRARDALDPGAQVFLTWIPGADPIATIEPAAKLQRSGLVPIPHIGARHLQSEEQLRDLIARFCEVGIDHILLIGGDRDTPAGPYDSSQAVLKSGVLQKAGIRHIAIAGFPEGHPKIAGPILDEALAAKVSLARSEGFEVSIVTQFCFEPQPIVEWLWRIRAAAIQVPVRIGVAGPAGLGTLTRYAIRCGIGNSLRVLIEKPSFARLLVEEGPEFIIQGVATASAEPNSESILWNVTGFHFYIFGGFQKTMEWISAKRARRFHASGNQP